MTVYEVGESTKEIKYNDRAEIKTGCTLEQADTSFARSYGRFDTLKDAEKELYKHNPSIVNITGGFYVTEYVIIIYQADDEGEFISGSDFVTGIEFTFDTENDKLVLNM